MLTRIDVHDVMKAKLNVEYRKYVILGACNPQLAHQALQGEPWTGLLLPCNVVVAEAEDASVVSAISPTAWIEGTNPQAIGRPRAIPKFPLK